MKKFYFLTTAFLAILLFGVNVQASAQDPPEIILIQPDVAGIVWEIDQSYLISWTDNFAEPVDIYYQKGLAGWVQIADDVPSSTWTWNTATNPGGLVAGSDYKIKIVKSDDVLIDAISANDFTFITNPVGGSYVHVIQPNVTGLSWEFGSTHLISWMDYLLEPVKIELFTSAGAPVSAADAGLTAATNLTGTTWSWTIPAAGGNLTAGNYKIRVTSTQSGTTYDESDNDFAITVSQTGGSYVDLIQPDDATGIVWEKGTTHVISWMDDCFEGVKLTLLYDNAGSWDPYTPPGIGTTTGLETATNVSGTTWSWPISTDIEDGDYKIKAESSVTTSINDISSESFEIVSSITGGTYVNLIQPDVAGIQWVPGQTYLISWMDDIFEGLDITLMLADGVTPYSGAGTTGLETATAVMGTTWGWEISTDIPDGDYKIKIASSVSPGTLNDVSTNTFKITTTPSGGSIINVIQPDVSGLVWRYGETHLISWWDDLIENVELQLWKDGTTQIVAADCGLTAASSLEGTTWSWSIPASGTGGGTLVNGNYKFKIVSTDPGSAVVGWSTNTFEITDIPPTGEIVVIQPNGGENWIKGNNYLISWTDNISENISVFISDDDFVSDSHELTPAGGVTGSTWTWDTENNWPYGATVIGTTYKIKVETAGTSATAPDLSDNTFNFILTNGGTVEIIQPNGGEVWVDENTYLISWNDDLIENVFIQLWDYSSGSGVLVPNTISGLPPYGASDPGVVGTTHSWYIPETGTTPGSDLIADEHYKIKVFSVLDPSYSGISDNEFEITDVFSGGTTVEVLQPNGGEELLEGWPYLIAWNDDVIENVFIKLYDNGVLVPAATSGLPPYGAGDPGVIGSTYDWTVPTGILGTQYRIEVVSIYDGALVDQSNNDFSIINAVTGGSFVEVIQPNGGEQILRGWPYLISWNDDVIENVDIELYKDDGGYVLVPSATSGLPATGGAGVPGSTHQWNVPAGLDVAFDYKIRVFSINDPNLEDYSANPFNVIATQTGGTYIDIIQPNGGESWINGNAYWLSWMDDVFEDVDIELYLYTSGGVFVDNFPIATDVVGTTHVWTIDNTVVGLTNSTVGFGTGDYFKLYVASNLTPGSLFDFSNDYFSITNSKSPLTGLNNSNSNSNVYIYPNPTSDQVSIAAIGIIDNIEITNLLGQVMYNSDIESASTELDVSGFDAGIYVINLTIEGEVVVKKLFIK